MKVIQKSILAGMLACTLAACTNYKTVTGSMKEPVKTMFYNFTVNDCYTTNAIQDYKPDDGKQFVVVNITVENLYKGKLAMTDGHFQLQEVISETSSEEDTEESGGVSNPVSSATAAAGDYAYPMTQTSDVLYLSDELPADYTLAEKETKTGTLIFEMPADEKTFNFCTADYFNYGSGSSVQGNTFFVEITPEAK